MRTKLSLSFIVASVATASFAQFGAPSRLDMVPSNGKTNGFFGSLYAGSNTLSATVGGSTQSASQPGFGFVLESVFGTSEDRNPFAIGYANFQGRSTTTLGTFNGSEIYARGYFSSIWGAGIGRITINGSSVTQFSLFADLIPNNKSLWRAQLGIGSYSGSGDSGGIGITRIAYSLGNDLFVDLSSRSFVSNSSGVTSDLTMTYIGISKKF